MTAYRRALIAIIVLTLFVAGTPVLMARLSAEATDHVVSLVADYQEFAAAAQERGVSVDTFLRRLHGAGVNALAVHEDSLASLAQEGLLSVHSGADLLDLARLGDKPPVPLRQIQPRATYVYGFASPALQAWLTGALRDRLGAGRVQAGNAVDRVTGDPAQVQARPLGYRPGELRRLAGLGFQIVVRPQDGPGLTASAIRRYFRTLGAQVPLHLVLFDGSLVMGYPQHLAAVAGAMNAAHLVLGAIEAPTQLGLVDQKGIRKIDQQIGERTVRVYSIPSWIIDRQPPPTVTTNVIEAIETRHDRVIYLHPFTAVTVNPSRVLSANVLDYGAIAAAVRDHGYRIGPVRPMPRVTVARWERMLLALGAVAGGLLLLSLIFPSTGWAWLVVLGLLALGFSAVSATLSREAASLGAAIAFGGLGAFTVARMWLHPPRRVWAEAVLHTLAAAGVALVGALFIATILGDTQHMLEWSYFRGVKVSYLAPPLLALVGYVVYTGETGSARGSFWRDAARFLDMPLAVKHVLLGGLVLGAGGIYLLRSGNVTSVLSIEAHLRAFLEHVLVYRPREKEFLIGYPSLFLATLFAHRRRPGWFLVFLLGASVAVVSLIDSFEHLRTPFLTSFLRSGTGLLLGLVLGSVVLGVVAAAIGWWERRRRAS